MTKNAIRTKYKALRQSLTLETVEEFSLAIANKLLHLDIWDKSFYHIFLPITPQKEVNTEYILNILSGKDKHIVVSKSQFEDRSMTHYLLTDNTRFETNAYGIPDPTGGIEISPAQLEVIFVPLLAFDVKGNRVGYGQGFYDRFLEQCNPGTLKIGLSFFEPEVEVLSAENHDISLDYVVTPTKIYQF